MKEPMDSNGTPYSQLPVFYPKAYSKGMMVSSDGSIVPIPPGYKSKYEYSDISFRMWYANYILRQRGLI